MESNQTPRKMGKLVGEKCPYCDMEAVFPDPQIDVKRCFNCGRQFSMGPVQQAAKAKETKPRGLFSRWR